MNLETKNEKGITMVALVITVIIIVILTNVLVYKAKDEVAIKSLTNLYNDISMLREKVSSYYNEYGKIPAEIKYTNIGGLSNVISMQNDTGDFYVIDLEAMQGITLNYGKDYEKVKNDEDNVDNYLDLYVINENSHNIFYIKGLDIKENNEIKTYYTDYIEPDQTDIDLRYIDGILIPDGYYYIGKTKTEDNSENESIVISNTQGDTIDTSKTNQYIWTNQISQLEQIPENITLEEKYQFIKSVKTYKGYFKNTEGKVQYVVIDEEKWSDPYKKEMEYKDRNGDKITIPQGYRISMAPTMNTVENGFVVKDSKDNEWVWVEVPKSIFTTAENNADYDNIKADLVRYSKEYREGAQGQNRNWEDEWYEGCGIENQDVYTEMYNKMLSSVYTNGGFWISRYEIGDNIATIDNTTRTSSSGKTGKAVSKPNQIPYNFVTCSEAQDLASGMATDENRTSSLMFGIQWNLTCKFIETNGDLNVSEIKGKEGTTGSTNWGNYSNSSITLDRGKYNKIPSSSASNWSDVTPSRKIENEKMLLTTGASEDANIMNIYDFAGNEWEITLEKATLNAEWPRTARGGGYNYSGSDYPASYKSHSNIDTKLESVGFRATMY